MKKFITLVCILLIAVGLACFSPLLSQITGTVKDIHGNPINAKVYLLERDYSITPSLIEESNTNNGEFIFEEKQRDESTILVIPYDSMYVSGYYDKYSNVVYEWEKASNIYKIGSDYNIKGPYNIVLDTITKSFGKGKIYGDVEVIFLSYFQKSHDTPLSIQGFVLLYLYDSENRIIKNMVLNCSGHGPFEYSFNDLDTGTYYLSADLAFIPKGDFPAKIKISEDSLNVNKDVIIVGSTDVKDSSNASSFNFYPNPSANTINITYPENMLGNKIEIFNPIGITVWSGLADAESKSIDVSHLAAGVYFLRIGNEIKMFVKE
jgi:hypothetical protein